MADVWGGAAPSAGRMGFSARSPVLRLGLAVASACVLGALISPALASASYRVQRVCGPPLRPGAAACLALKLVPAALTSADLHATAVRQSQEVREGTPAAVTQKAPIPGYLTPQSLHVAYSLPSESGSASTQTIAVVDAFDDPTAEADLAVYDAEFGLPACTSANGCFRKLNEQGAAAPLPPVEGEWAGEISIDVQMAHAICTGCHVLLVEANSEEFSDLGAAVDTAVKAGATEISNSYAGPEEAASLAESASFYDHPGVVVTAASGDCGYLNHECEEQALANFPAASPDVLAVGGTKLKDGGSGWKSTVWSGSGSGCSAIFAAPLWQSSLPEFAATGCGQFREEVDVAAIGDPNTGVDVYDSTPEGNGDPTGWGVWGGTSVASPIIAAEFALAGGAHGVAYPAATLYSHLGEPSALDDVTSGANGSCSGASSCTAGKGYDGPSGVGSPIGLEAFSTTVNPAPTVAGFAPETGITGSAVTISGKGLGATTAVQFGKLTANFKVISTTQVEAIVPNGAKAGKITLTTPLGILKSKTKFTPTLSLVSFSPAGGLPGSIVKLKGVGFNPGASVSFDGVSATNVTYFSASKLTVVVPPGASAGAITVTNSAQPAGSVNSAASYTVG